MFGLLNRLFDKAFEPCKGCEVLKTQLEITNKEKAELIQTVISLVKPEVIQQPVTAVAPIINKSIPWAMRKKQLEENDREQMRIKREQEELNKKLNVQGTELKPITTPMHEEIESLEKELGVEDASQIG